MNVRVEIDLATTNRETGRNLLCIDSLLRDTLPPHLSWLCQSLFQSDKAVSITGNGFSL